MVPVDIPKDLGRPLYGSEGDYFLDVGYGNHCTNKSSVGMVTAGDLE